MLGLEEVNIGKKKKKGQPKGKNLGEIAGGNQDAENGVGPDGHNISPKSTAAVTIGCRE